jgi:hypothetical protein
MNRIVHTLMIVMLSGALPRGEQANVRIAFDGGRVTLAANDALVGDVLAEWARVGGTLFTGADRIPPVRITVDLVELDETSAIETVIGSANGFLATRRTDGPVGSSRLGRVAIALPSSVAAALTPAPGIDMSIPEARFEFAAPSTGGSPDDPDSTTAKVLAVRPPSTPASAAPTEPPPMPEMLFQYVAPMTTVPAETDLKPEDKAKKPDDKAKKPEDEGTKQPPSDATAARRQGN